MIKSGGEWISSIELENIAMNHPEVRPSSLDRTQSRIPFSFVSPLRFPATEIFSSSTQCELLYIEMLPVSVGLLIYPSFGHYQVALAAVIAMPHRKWDERPLLIVVLKDSAALSLHSSATSSSPSTSSDTDRAIRLTKEALLDHFKGKVAKWWVPDDVIFVDSLPQGPTGKILKTELRQRFSRRP